MSCGVIRKQKYTDSTLLEPTEAGNFEAVAITFKMDAKRNDRNEHEQKKRPLTRTPLCCRPHSFLFSPSKSILFLRRYWLTSIWQISKAVGKLCDIYNLESKAMATSHTSQSLHQCNARTSSRGSQGWSLFGYEALGTRSRKRWYFCTASGGTSKNLELKGKFLEYLCQLS